MIKRIVGGILLLGVLVALCVFILSNQTKPPQSVRLPNGDVVTFIGTTFGTNHTMAWGKPYQRSLYKILPAKLKSWSGASLGNTFTTSNTNDPVFWLDSIGPMTNGGYPAMRLLDEYGCEFDPDGYSAGMSYFSDDRQNGKEIGSHFQFGASFPSGKIIGLCIYDSEAKTQRVGNFLIPGAVLVPLPGVMQPTNLPKQDGELTFQLVSVATGLKCVPFNYSMLTNGGLFSQATFRLTKNGRPDTTWFPVNINAIDAHGQAIRLGRHTLAHKDDAAIFNIEGLLDPAAGPFKLRVEFMHQSDYSPEELVTFKNVPFPAMQQTTDLQQRAQTQGEQITLERVIGSFSEEVNDPTAQAGTTFFEVTMLPATNSIHLDLIKSLDEQGNPLSVNYGRALGKGKFRYGYPPGSKAKSMDLTFAVHKSRFVEFEVTPILFSTNAIYPK